MTKFGAVKKPYLGLYPKDGQEILAAAMFKLSITGAAMVKLFNKYGLKTSIARFIKTEADTRRARVDELIAVANMFQEKIFDRLGITRVLLNPDEDDPEEFAPTEEFSYHEDDEPAPRIEQYQTTQRYNENLAQNEMIDQLCERLKAVKYRQSKELVIKLISLLIFTAD